MSARLLGSSSRATPLPLSHKDTYPSISASHNPCLSQAGKTILITGGGVGVGFFIARQFAKAGASRLILAGRRQIVLESGASRLQAEHPGLAGSIIARSVDVTDGTSTAELWGWVSAQELVVDVLVLAHGRPCPLQDLLDTSLDTVREFYDVNVFAFMNLTQQFWKHLNDNPDLQAMNGPAVIINVATAGVWDYISCGPVPIYSLTKNGGTMLLQQIAKDVDPEKLRIVSYHPGLIKTDATKNLFPLGYVVPWDTPELAGDFAVWLASPEAGFLHGRFVHSGFDVDELRGGEIRDKIDADPFLLKVGVLGFHP